MDQPFVVNVADAPALSHPRRATIIHSVYKVLRVRPLKGAERVSYTISLVLNEVEGSMKQSFFVDCKELLPHVLRTKKRPDNLVSSSPD